MAFILQHKKDQEWKKLQIETLKGKQIVSQLESAIREIDNVGQTLALSDASEFAHKISPFKAQAVQAINKFLESSQLKNIQESSTGVHAETEDSSWEMPSHEQLSQQIHYLPEEIEVEQRRAQLETVQNLQHDMEVKSVILHTINWSLFFNIFKWQFNYTGTI